MDELGRFTMGTANGKGILHDHPYPESSYTSIQLSNAPVFSIFKADGPPQINTAATEAVSTMTLLGTTIKQYITIVNNPSTNRKDIFRIRYEMTNTSGSSLDYGVRIMLDTLIVGNGRGDKLWVDALANAGFWSGTSKDKFIQDSDGNPGVLGVDRGRDDFGADNSLKELVERLERDFGKENGETHDVIFWPYNWLGDLNDSLDELEVHINDNNYTDVVFVTHSTGGLLASAYISKSIENKRKVDKAILIAAPLFGTYASLLPIERGDSGKFLKQSFKSHLIDAVTQNSWIRSWAKNSPTTYQLLPSDEYLKHLPLKVGWPDKEMAYASISDFYRMLNQSDRINPKLTNGSSRSHQYFRNSTLNGNVVNEWSGAALMEVDTLLMGTAFGRLTPAKAVYDGPFIERPSMLSDMVYDKNGDGTVQGFSAMAQRKEDTTPVLPSIFTYTANHSKLLKDDDVLDAVSAKIHEEVVSTGMSTASHDVGSNMSEMIRIRYSSDAPVVANIRDELGNLVADAAGWEHNGFDSDDFMYDSFSDDEQIAEALIYMPNQGYNANMIVGERALIRPQFSPATATELEMVYSVNETDIIDINRHGVIHALAAGSVVVTGETAYGIRDEFTVTIIDESDFQAVASDKSTLTWDSIKGVNNLPTDVTANLVLPVSGASGSLVTWVSSNEAIISAAGICHRPSYSDGDAPVSLTAFISKGIVSDTLTFKLTVPKSPHGPDDEDDIEPDTGTSLILDKSYLVLQKNQNNQLEAYDSSAPGVAMHVNWKSSKTSVATVSPDGWVSAVGVGTTIITAYVDGMDIAAECRVDVIEKPPGDAIQGVKFLQSTVTSNALSTNYAMVPLQLVLEQNSPGAGDFSAIDSSPSSETDESVRQSIRSLRLLSDLDGEHFMARAVDDRFVELIPTVGLKTAKLTVLKTKMEVEFTDGARFVTYNDLTIKITRTKPTLRANSVRFNSFFPDAPVGITITPSLGKIRGR